MWSLWNLNFLENFSKPEKNVISRKTKKIRFSYLETNLQSLGNCLLCSLFASCYPALCYCSISSSCHIDSAYSVSGSCNTSVAILTQLEAVLQLICSSILYLQQGRGSTLVSLFLLKLLWRHNIMFLSRSSFNISSLSLLSHSFVLDVFFTAVVTAFWWVTKTRMKAPGPMSSWYTLLCFDICLLAYSDKHAVMLALNHGISRLLAQIFFT